MRRIAHVTALLLAFAAFSASANEAEVRAASLQAVEEGLVLNADFAFELSQRLEEIVANGVPLYFRVEFELTRRRWYWLDEKAAARQLQLRLSYHALSRHYRLSSGVLQQNFATLGEALNVLRRLPNCLGGDRAATFWHAGYEAAVRLRPHAGMLPRPFRLSALPTG